MAAAGVVAHGVGDDHANVPGRWSMKSKWQQCAIPIHRDHNKGPWQVSAIDQHRMSRRFKIEGRDIFVNRRKLLYRAVLVDDKRKWHYPMTHRKDFTHNFALVRGWCRGIATRSPMPFAGKYADVDLVCRQIRFSPPPEDERQ